MLRIFRYASEADAGAEASARPSRNPLMRVQRAFERWFERVREHYHGLLQLALTHRRAFVIGFVVGTERYDADRLTAWFNVACASYERVK